jgi:DNA invertase Pin-like site-specific DNA recombinase
MNTVIYARYSSAGQTEQSIEGQLRVCKEYAERNGYFVIGEYIDRATTGTNDNRPEFQRLLEDAKKQEFTYVLVYKLDRFARNKYDSVVHKHNLGKLGIRVISATETISDSPEGALLEGLLEMVAEMFSKDLSQKVKRGMRESRLKGHFVGGTLLYGYKIVDKKPVVDEDKAQAVRLMFEGYAKGKGKKQIVAELNAKGYRTNKGKPFTFNSLEYCMSNRKYIGVDNADGVENVTRYPRIIEDELFNAVQARLETTRKRPAANKADIEYFLSGKCFCDL